MLMSYWHKTLFVFPPSVLCFKGSIASDVLHYNASTQKKSSRLAHVTFWSMIMVQYSNWSQVFLSISHKSS
jgi:hypothetical protein